MYSLHRGAPGKSTTACITPLHVAYEIILADFNLAVLTLTAKLPNLIPHQILQLYGSQYDELMVVCCTYETQLPCTHIWITIASEVPLLLNLHQGRLQNFCKGLACTLQIHEILTSTQSCL